MIIYALIGFIYTIFTGEELRCCWGKLRVLTSEKLEAFQVVGQNLDLKFL